MTGPKDRKFRSESWFNDPDDPHTTALHLGRHLNDGLTRRELQSGRPIIGIAPTGSDLVPCNRHHLELANRVEDGIREAGGVPLEFPVHPLHETGKRPTAALDRDLACLGLVEDLRGYPLDGVVLTTGCDKTTPACLMAAATVNLPASVLSGGSMLDGRLSGKRVGSDTVIRDARRRLATGEIGYEECMDLIASSAPSAGHCNTMSTALSMNVMAEALGMSLTGCAAIPAPCRERQQMAFETGRAAVRLVRDDIRPTDIMTHPAFLTAIAVASAIGAATNCPPHLMALARHLGVDLAVEDFQAFGFEVSFLADVQPAGRYLGEDFHEAGGAPAVMKELLAAGKLDGEALTVSGKPLDPQRDAGGRDRRRHGDRRDGRPHPHRSQCEASRSPDRRRRACPAASGHAPFGAGAPDTLAGTLPGTRRSARYRRLPRFRDGIQGRGPDTGRAEIQPLNGKARESHERLRTCRQAGDHHRGVLRSWHGDGGAFRLEGRQRRADRASRGCAEGSLCEARGPGALCGRRYCR
jgi:dihydroxyacid dehydratase/phosphogluconate dehydratase